MTAKVYRAEQTVLTSRQNEPLDTRVWQQPQSTSITDINRAIIETGDIANYRIYRDARLATDYYLTDAIVAHEGSQPRHGTSEQGVAVLGLLTQGTFETMVFGYFDDLNRSAIVIPGRLLNNFYEIQIYNNSGEVRRISTVLYYERRLPHID